MRLRHATRAGRIGRRNSRARGIRVDAAWPRPAQAAAANETTSTCPPGRPPDISGPVRWTHDGLVRGGCADFFSQGTGNHHDCAASAHAANRADCVSVQRYGEVVNRLEARSGAADGRFLGCAMTNDLQNRVGTGKYRGAMYLSNSAVTARLAKISINRWLFTSRTKRICRKRDVLSAVNPRKYCTQYEGRRCRAVLGIGKSHGALP